MRAYRDPVPVASSPEEDEHGPVYAFRIIGFCPCCSNVARIVGEYTSPEIGLVHRLRCDGLLLASEHCGFRFQIAMRNGVGIRWPE